MLLRATLSGTVIIGAMGLVASPRALLALRIAQGCFTGTVSAAATLVAAGTPRHRSGYALGFLSSSTFIGLSFGPLAGGLAAEHLGYRYSFFIGGAILFAAMLLSLFLVRELREEGQEPPGAEEKGPGDRMTWKTLVLPLIPFLAILFLLRTGRQMPQSFLPLRVQEIRGATEGSASAMGFISAGAGFVTALSGIALGRLGDRYSKLRLIALCALAAFLLEIPIALSRGMALFALFYILLSFAAGGIEPQLQALISSRAPADRRGLLFGLQTTVGSLGWASAPMIGSWISLRHSLSAIFIGGGAFFLAAALTAGTVLKKEK